VSERVKSTASRGEKETTLTEAYWLSAMSSINLDRDGRLDPRVLTSTFQTPN